MLSKYDSMVVIAFCGFYTWIFFSPWLDPLTFDIKMKRLLWRLCFSLYKINLKPSMKKKNKTTSYTAGHCIFS